MDRKQLRPYYDHDLFNAGYPVIFKPGVGLVDPESNRSITSSLATNILDRTKNELYNPSKSIGIRALDSGINRSSGDKNYLYDLEFHEYFDYNNLSELFKNLIWNFCRNYFKVVLMQPLEIVRLVLQVGEFKHAAPSASKTLSGSKSNDSSGSATSSLDESDSDAEIDYFQSTTLNDKASIARNIEESTQAVTESNPNKVELNSTHTMEIMAALVNKDGPLALFRGINATFIHQTLTHTIEAWITGFVSPFLGIPDPFFLDLTHSTDPLRSLWLSVTACILTGIVLIPLDLVKVRLMITEFNKPPNPESNTNTRQSDVNRRSIRESIRNYPLKLLIHPPTNITILTVLHQFSTTIFRKAAPYFLFIRFNIDSYSSPNLYTVVNLLSSIMEFFVKLPVENLLRKEQVKFLLDKKPEIMDNKQVATIQSPDEVIININSGLTHEHSGSTNLWDKLLKLGLFNGWRVGVLNVIGFWGYNILKSDGTQLREERL